ncbi:ATP-binding protein [Petroclostridium sp. X23]|uniref:ATP-binding protein n=1 Tax=Petroclostridium sp. X23 TaxID=3045146 RepID=UPI0024AE0223|nr:ATP-binding protein [Petroclostridium sp. X23]WHH60980.1 ATP-binding protein [Petroclostridium sp. X23]
MRAHDENTSFNNTLIGDTVDAEYKKQLLIHYSNNPMIEALPPILSPEEAISKIRYQPFFDVKEKELPSYLRLHCVERIRDFVEPLNKHIEIEQAISRIIRHGYIAKHRNPLTKEYTKLLNISSEAVRRKDINYVLDLCPNRSTSTGFTLIGLSGMGKTTAIEKVLLQYPQIITHSNYKDRQLFKKQIVWIKLDCPHDGSTKGLCLDFFQTVDSLIQTDYCRKYGSGRAANAMLPAMSHVSILHSMGILVIDEIQNLSLLRTGGANELLNFFVNLVNKIGMPVVLIGTPEATGTISEVFKNGRRGTGEIIPIWARMEKDNEWDTFVRELWRYQWNRIETSLTPEFSDILYEESQGIPDVAVKLFILAQWRVITTGEEKMSRKAITSVARDSLTLISPALNLLRSGNNKLSKYPDLYIPDIYLESYKNKCIKRSSNSLNDSKESKKDEKVDTKEKKVSSIVAQISLWLVQSGTERKKSEKVAKNVVEKLGCDTNISILLREAFTLAGSETQTIPSDNSKNTPKAIETTEKQNYSEGLVGIPIDVTESPQEIGKYLEDKDIIKNPLEFDKLSI